MPSIDAVEQFKSIVQGLAHEPEIREQMGMPPEEILPPESQVDTDLADLLGAIPQEPEAAPEAEPASEGEFDDLFADPVPSPDEAPEGPNLDDLLGPAAEAPEEALPSFDEALPSLDEPLPSLDDPLPSFDEPLPSFDEPMPELDAVPDVAGDLGDLDDLLEPAGDEPLDLLEPDAPGPTRSSVGVAPEDLDDSFFDTPGEDLFNEPSSPAVAADFPELAGFGDTKEEDVEAFDELGEADEFQLGDFESQFGITADDHTDAELLNPAQAVDLEVEAAQKTLSLTEAEFTAIQRALGQLPLNLRLAVEELLGESEVVFDDLDKVVRMLLNKAPVRTLANTVGKLLGKKIIIPPGFEKGSGEELEARQSTLWYNLRTIMFPVLRVSLMVTAAAALLVLLGWNFLMRPLKANDLYDRGLVQARANHGAQADELFAQAWYYWPAQDRFFQYAETYQDTGDFDRARRKYLELLKPSVKPYNSEDKARLDTEYAKPLAPLPTGLEGKALADRLAEKRGTLDRYYAYVVRLLSTSATAPQDPEDVPGEVVLGNPDAKGILDYSRFETDFGFDGRDREAHFRRADVILKPLLAEHPGDKAGLLRKGDNQLAWSQALSSHDNLDLANAAFSEYLRLYGYDAPITWRFVKVFLLEDQEEELLKFRDRIANDSRLAMDGEVMAQLAKWLLDKEELSLEEDRVVPVTQKTIEDEYGIKAKVEEPELVRTPMTGPESPVVQAAAAAKAKAAEAPPAAEKPAAEAAPAAEHRLVRSEAAAEGGGGGAEGEKKPPEITPPFKYPYKNEKFRPDFLDKVDTLLLRAMETQKSLPELHYQISRFYKHLQNPEDERRALGAADTYFQRLAPRMVRLNGRPAMRVATSNRIGEVFEAQGQPVQAEKYYLDAQKNFDSFRAQGLVVLDTDTARLFRNLGSLYYRQTPGVEAIGKGTIPGGWEQALKLFETAAQAHWEEPAMDYRMGVIAYEKRDFAGSVKEFFALDRPGNKGEASGRTNPNLLYAMGNALFRTGNFASAEGYYRELLDQLRERRAKIKEFDPVGRSAHKALAQRLYETWNNLAAAQYRAANTFRSGTPEFKEAIAALTTARAQAQILGRDLYGDRAEFDLTRANLAAIREDERRILQATRREKGLVEANLQVLSMIETATPARKEVLADQLEIFARIPLELDQLEAP